MYWGDSSNPFESLVAFVAGFNHALITRGVEGPNLVPGDFDTFVWRRVGSGPMNGHGWASAIRMAANSPREAFELFFTLREEYEALRDAQ
jgi:hypothetical protein